MPAVQSIEKKLKAKPKEESIAKEEESAKESANQVVTEKKLLDAWKILKDKTIEKGKDQERILLSQEVYLDGTNIIIKIMNDVQEILFDKIKSGLLSDLRNTLKNSKLTITVERQAVDPSKMIYTNKEKYNHLAKDNPELKELKNRLGLDTDF